MCKDISLLFEFQFSDDVCFLAIRLSSLVKCLLKSLFGSFFNLIVFLIVKSELIFGVVKYYSGKSYL